MPRFFCPAPLSVGSTLELPSAAARHVQVVRMQPGQHITLFNCGPGWDGPSPGGEFEATITRMGRSSVDVQVLSHGAVEREAARNVHLVVGMPANDRMDWLVEKACELGVSSIQPVMTERSVLRLTGDRAIKKVDHWQSVAIAACEQCGGNRVPVVHPVVSLAQWLQRSADRTANVAANVTANVTGGGMAGDTVAMQRFLLSLAPQSRQLDPSAAGRDVQFLSGPEGGLSAAEEAAAMDAGYLPVSLGSRVLRAETAALSALATLVLGA